MYTSECVAPCPIIYDRGFMYLFSIAGHSTPKGPLQENAPRRRREEVSLPHMWKGDFHQSKSEAPHIPEAHGKLVTLCYTFIPQHNYGLFSYYEGKSFQQSLFY